MLLVLFKLSPFCTACTFQACILDFSFATTNMYADNRGIY